MVVGVDFRQQPCAAGIGRKQLHDRLMVDGVLKRQSVGVAVRAPVGQQPLEYIFGQEFHGSFLSLGFVEDAKGKGRANEAPGSPKILFVSGGLLLGKPANERISGLTTAPARPPWSVNPSRNPANKGRPEIRRSGAYHDAAVGSAQADIREMLLTRSGFSPAPRTRLPRWGERSGCRKIYRFRCRDFRQAACAPGPTFPCVPAGHRRPASSAPDDRHSRNTVSA